MWCIQETSSRSSGLRHKVFVGKQWETDQKDVKFASFELLELLNDQSYGCLNSGFLLIGDKFLYSLNDQDTNFLFFVFKSMESG